MTSHQTINPRPPNTINNEVVKLINEDITNITRI